MKRGVHPLARAFASMLAGLLASAAGAQTRVDPGGETPSQGTQGRWSWDALYTVSNLDHGHGDWQQVQTEWLYKASPKWVLGFDADARRREGADDVIYGASAEFYPDSHWTWHANVWETPGATFTFRHGAALGAEWSASPRIALSLDARSFGFPAGDLIEWRPGLKWSFDDANALSGRYTFGRAFGSVDYHAWSLKFDHDFGRGRKLSLGYSRGIDPETDPGVPGVLLSEGDMATATYRFPMGSKVDLLLGAEVENRRPAYDRIGVSIGVAARF